MKRVGKALGSLFILLLLVSGASAGEVLTNESVLAMVKTGVAEKVIIGKIKASQNQFDLSPQALLRLEDAGVGRAVLRAMAEAAAPPPPPRPQSAEEVARETQEAIALYRQGKPAEAVVAFDKLIAQQPNDDALRIWKAKALLEQAREMRASKLPKSKPMIIDAWAILKAVGPRQARDPDWNFTVGKALWLNARPERGRRAAERAIALRPSFAEAHLLVGDIAYEECEGLPVMDPRGDNPRLQGTMAARKAYETTLAIADLPADLRAEALYKLGSVSADLENKKPPARELWERAAAADPTSRYGRMAEERLRALPVR